MQTIIGERYIVEGTPEEMVEFYKIVFRMQETTKRQRTQRSTKKRGVGRPKGSKNGSKKN